MNNFVFGRANTAYDASYMMDVDGRVLSGPPRLSAV